MFVLYFLRSIALRFVRIHKNSFFTYSPGHSDFSAEVDRILGVADGFVLVVDATEGPKSQTKYVLTRALALGLKPIVVLNKCDRSTSRLDETETQILDLFDVLGATEEQLEYITVYASAREGWVSRNDDLTDKQSMGALLDLILEQIPEPTVIIHESASEGNETMSLKPDALMNDKFSLAAVSVGYDSFLGRTCSGRIMSGSIRKNDNVVVLPRNGQQDSSGSGPPSTISGIFVHEGIRRVPLEDVACAGDYVTLTGVPDSICVGDTLTGVVKPILEPLDTPPLAPPTLAMDFGANDGPLAGQEGSRIASSQIRDRLMSEADNNVTLKITENESDVDKTVVYARGELQLGILVEQMRREGFELLISPPRILTKICPDTGKTLEPYEELVVDVDSEYAGAVINLLTGQERQAVLQNMSNQEEGKTQLVFEMPSRGMLGGFRSELATATRGSAIVHHIFIGDRERTGSESSLHEKGKLVSNASGKASAFALSTLEARGILFVGPGEEVYSGMVIGENSRPGDLEVNPIKAKEKTNMRTQAKDEKIQLSNPKRMSVEELIAYMSPDEMIEVTPVSVRLRKKLLESGARERAARTKAKQLRALKD